MALKNKIALVLGGSGALGSTIVKRFLKEGAIVFSTYVTDKEPRGIAQSDGDRFTMVRTNVTDEASVISLFDTIIKQHQKVEIVVNTVGGYAGGKFVRDTPLEDWNRMVDINLTSAFMCTREALRRMRGQSYGRIINTSAMAGLQPSPGKAAYAISKAGVALLTELAAKEENGTGVTINAIAPSIILTPANLRAMPEEDSTKWVTPEDIADIICYLCSDAAGALTGTTLRAFGGV